MDSGSMVKLPFLGRIVRGNDRQRMLFVLFVVFVCATAATSSVLRESKSDVEKRMLGDSNVLRSRSSSGQEGWGIVVQRLCFFYRNRRGIIDYA